MSFWYVRILLFWNSDISFNIYIIFLVWQWNVPQIFPCIYCGLASVYFFVWADQLSVFFSSLVLLLFSQQLYLELFAVGPRSSLWVCAVVTAERRCRHCCRIVLSHDYCLWVYLYSYYSAGCYLRACSWHIHNHCSTTKHCALLFATSARTANTRICVLSTAVWRRRSLLFLIPYTAVVVLQVRQCSSTPAVVFVATLRFSSSSSSYVQLRRSGVSASCRSGVCHLLYVFPQHLWCACNTGSVSAAEAMYYSNAVRAATKRLKRRLLNIKKASS